MDKRTFVIRLPSHVDACLSVIRNNWQQLLVQNAPMQVTISEYRVARSLEQNSLMWVTLESIARDGWVAGRKYSAEVWNQFYKEAYLPDETAKGKRKWDIMPDGSRRLVLSTADLNVSEMTEYLNKLMAHATTELGVEI